MSRFAKARVTSVSSSSAAHTSFKKQRGKQARVQDFSPVVVADSVQKRNSVQEEEVHSETSGSQNEESGDGGSLSDEEDGESTSSRTGEDDSEAGEDGSEAEENDPEANEHGSEAEEDVSEASEAEDIPASQLVLPAKRRIVSPAKRAGKRVRLSPVPTPHLPAAAPTQVHGPIAPHPATTNPWHQAFMNEVAVMYGVFGMFGVYDVNSAYYAHTLNNAYASYHNYLNFQANQLRRQEQLARERNLIQLGQHQGLSNNALRERFPMTFAHTPPG